MKIDLSDFSTARINETMEDVEEGFQLYVKKGALSALSDLVNASPVDTGRFRGAWVTSIDKASFEVPPVGGESYPNNAVSEGAGVIESSDPFTAIFIQNNVEYGPFLDDGSSSQAPSGFVEMAVESAFK